MDAVGTFDNAPATGHETYTLTVKDLTYKVTVKTKGEVEEKVLLNGVNATANHGEVLAVVGPSGAGKSTFLDAVAGRIDLDNVEGAILVNGRPVEESFKRLSGYVMQDDALFPMLTVRETLMFSARLRLPAEMGYADKQTRVENLMDELGLKQCADTIIGNNEVRGVSGGERRRVSIGVDLIHDPPVLFLDEPTSGLDSTSALNVIQNLHDIAEQRKRTIVLTIHQPSFRILELIHRFLILARGSVIYHGPYEGMADFFQSYGKEVPEQENLLEFSLDVIEEQQESEEGLAPLIKHYYDRERQAAPGLAQASMGGVHLEPDYATSMVSETLVLADRTAKNIIRTPELFQARIGLMALTAFSLGTLFINARYSTQGVIKRQGFFSFAIALFIFTTTEALPVFLAEKVIFVRETSRGAYRTASYVLSNAIVFLPFLLAQALLFTAISYFIVGLVADASAWFVFLIVAWFTLAVANSFVIFFSAVMPNFITGNTIVTALSAFFFMSSGYFLPRDRIPKWWWWLHYLSTFKYPLEVMNFNEFDRLRSHCFNKNSSGVCTYTAENVLQGNTEQGVQIWVNLLVMAGMFVVYRVLFYLVLVQKAKAVRK